jgi:hypothetical protein
MAVSEFEPGYDGRMPTINCEIMYLTLEEVKKKIIMIFLKDFSSHWLSIFFSQDHKKLRPCKPEVLHVPANGSRMRYAGTKFLSLSLSPLA